MSNRFPVLDRIFLWRVGYCDPEHPDDVLCGGDLAVWDDGRVDPIGSAPGERDMLDAEMRFTQSLVNALSLPDDWNRLLGGECHKPYWEKLQILLRAERAQHDVFPPEDQLFTAFHFTRYADTRVVILGQDPYPNPGEAHGLCFSVPDGIGKPRSLINIYKLLQADRRIVPPSDGNLEGWARQGVLLLNTILTVRQGAAGSHLRWGWETFTDQVISVVNAKPHRVVFILWGEPAREKKHLIDTSRHSVIESAHPVSRANARIKFAESRPFSQTNQLLEESGLTPIDWASLSSATEQLGTETTSGVDV